MNFNLLALKRKAQFQLLASEFMLKMVELNLEYYQKLKELAFSEDEKELVESMKNFSLEHIDSRYRK